MSATLTEYATHVALIAPVPHSVAPESAYTTISTALHSVTIADPAAATIVTISLPMPTSANSLRLYAIAALHEYRSGGVAGVCEFFGADNVFSI